jgi:hypothetical protein
MAKLSDLIINIGANTKGLNKALGDSQRRIKATTGNIQNLGKQMSIAFTLPAALLGGTALKAYDVQAQAIAQVEAGLRSTGNTAGYTSEQLQKMASDLQSKTIFGDEAILKDATAQLLTFTNISGEQFARTQKAALDLATRLDGDLKGASIQLGKALNDPIANLSALSRSGIQFSTDQKTVIKSLTETGRLAEAQTLILDELEKQYGGSAEAAAAAGMGGIKQLQNSFGDLQEEFGKVISDMLPPLIDFGKEVLASFSNMSEGMKKGIVIITGVVAAVGPMLFVLPKLVEGYGLMKEGIVKGVIPALKKMMAFMVANPYLLVAAAVAAITVAVIDSSTALSEYEKLQESLSKKMSEVGAEAGAQFAKVKQLESAVLDETKAEKERIAALNELQRIAPDHFGNLTLETASYETLTGAVEQYKQSLMEAARVKALQKQLDEVSERMVEIEMGAKSSMGTLESLFAAATGNTDIRIAQKTRKETYALYQQQQELIEQLAEVKTVQDVVSGSTAQLGTQFQTTGAKVKKAATEVEDFAETFRRSLIEDLKNTPLELPVKPKMKLHTIDPIEEDTSSFDMDFEKDYEKFKEGQEMMRSEWEQTAARTQQFGEMFGQTIGSVVSGGETAGEAMKKLAVNVVQTLIGIAQAAVIANATQTATATGAAALPMTPILIAAGLGLVSAAIGAIAFADGGIVSGPTLGLVGEYAGAKNNPEVIAPLDKLKSMIGDTGGGRMAVYGKLQGSDINISGERGKQKLNRTR